MNKERILEMADIIERTPHAKESVARTAYDTRAPEFFDMAITHCGSTACIGGFVRWKVDGTNEAHDIEWAVAEYFEISDNQANAICYPPFGIDYETITSAQASKLLRNFAESGAVDWNAVLEARP